MNIDLKGKIIATIIIVIISFLVLFGAVRLSEFIWSSLESNDLRIIMHSISCLFIGIGLGKIAAIAIVRIFEL